MGIPNYFHMFGVEKQHAPRSEPVRQPSKAFGIQAHRKGFTAKRVFDFSLALFAIVFFAPILALLSLFLLATQGRPIFIRHQRVGWQGKAFPCFKFRTMVTDADEVLQRHLRRNAEARLEWAATRKLKHDPRITALGHVLRKSSVDELPQLVNILRGEMSFVGPRPIVRDEAAHYGQYFSHYMHVRPGLTGLWQISGRNDTSYQTRVQLDVQYVAQRSFARDIGIIVRTIPAVLRSKGSY